MFHAFRWTKLCLPLGLYLQRFSAFDDDGGCRAEIGFRISHRKSPHHTHRIPMVMGMGMGWVWVRTAVSMVVYSVNVRTPCESEKLHRFMLQ